MENEGMETSAKGTDQQAASTGIRPAPASFWRRNAHKVAALCFWLLVLGGYQWYAWSHGLSSLDALRRLVDLLSRSASGPLLFIVLYAVRPLVLFPATLLTLGAGMLFGPVFGVIYTVVGSNSGALIAYAVGRYFAGYPLGPAPAGPLQGDRADGLLQRYTERLRTNSFMTVLTMRFVFLPYDLVNYVAGFLRIDWKAFLLATALGSLPATVAVVLAGASLHGDLGRGAPRFDGRVFAVSAVILVASLVLSRWAKRRSEAPNDGSPMGERAAHVANGKG